MKSYKILLFICSVFLMLGAISAAIPTEGIMIYNKTVTFPQIADIVQSDEEDDKINIYKAKAKIDGESIAEFIMNRQLSEMNLVRKKAINSTMSIDFPNDSVEWLDEVFEALQNAEQEPVRVLHYGDSQIEEDRISGNLRASLQSLFGGYGVGIVPFVQNVATSAIGQSASAENDIYSRYLVYGPDDMRLDSRTYGVMGQSVRINGTFSTSFYPINLKYTYPNTKKFGQITIMVDSIVGELTASVTVGNRVIEKKYCAPTNFINFELGDSTSRATVTLKGNALVYGILVDGNENGVALDNVAMRGCSGTIFTSISPASMKKYFNNYNVPLIIMQFGGNSVPYIKNEKQVENYCKSLSKQINYLKRLSPESKILFVGPSDMSTRINNKMVTYPHLSGFIDELRDMCNENDVAYWDLYKAMGGENSMENWVNSDPPLASKDYIHFTQKGADHASKLLFKAINLAYEFYIYREENE
ncbi:MAG: GDSL-type esterase/lipase family protein [bacterium]